MATKKSTRTSKVSNTKKTTKKAATKVSRSTAKADVSKKLNAWNWLLAFIYAAQGVAIAHYGEPMFHPFTTSYLAQDPLASTSDSPVYVQAIRTLFDVNIQYLVVFVLLFAAVFHVYNATIGRKKYETALATKVNRLRWIEYAITGGLAVQVIGLLSGVSDIATLSVMFGLVVAMYALSGEMMEKAAAAERKTDWLKYGFGIAAGVAAWMVIKMAIYGAYRYGDGLPASTYWLAASVFGIFSVQGIMQYTFYRRKAFARDYMNYEWTHMIVSFGLKSAFAWQVFAAFLR